MKRLFMIIAIVLVSTAPLFAKDSEDDDDDSQKTGATKFVVYDGDQNWPAGKTPVIDKSHAVPIYEGLPTKKYTVLGRIIDDREGIDVVGKELGGFFGGSKKRFRNIANQAKQSGGDAVVITNDERVLGEFGISRKDRKESSPLSKDRDHIVLVVKF